MWALDLFQASVSLGKKVGQSFRTPQPSESSDEMVPIGTHTYPPDKVAEPDPQRPSNNLETLYSLIRKYEGLRLMPYFCPAGVLTCGYGSTGFGIALGVPWTAEQAEARMRQDVHQFVVGVNKLCPSVNGDTLVALVDFSYNLGLGRLAGSTLRKAVLANDWPKARREITKWVMANGKPLKGLVKRRGEERDLLPTV